MGYKGEGGWHPPKKPAEERVFIFYRRYPSNPIQQTPPPPPPPPPHKMNRLLSGYRISERALDHEKFRAIKKKLSR